MQKISYRRFSYFFKPFFTHLLFFALFLICNAVAHGVPVKTGMPGKDTSSEKSKTGFETLKDRDTLKPISKADEHPVLDDDQASRKKDIFKKEGWLYWPLADKVFTIVSSAFLITALVLILLILYMRIDKNIKARKTEAINVAFENFAGDILFADDLPAIGQPFNTELQAIISTFENNHLQTRFEKRVVLKILLNLHKNLSGETAGVLQNLYFRLGFYEDSLRDLKSREWYVKALALTALKQMEARDAYRSIYANSHDRNRTLRFVAQIAVLTLKRTKHLAFLAGITEELSDWQQLNLLAALSKNMQLNLDGVGKLLGSLNETVVQLGIKLVQHYNIVEQSEPVMYLLYHPSEKVRAAAIRCLSFLEIDEAHTILKEQFAYETPFICLEIITAMGNLGSNEDIAWLEEVTLSNNLEMAQEARYAIAKLTKGGEKEVEEMWG